MSLIATLSTPLMAFGGALSGVVLNRRATKELEMRSRREEAMRNLRWAAELAARDDDARFKLRVKQLSVLGGSGLMTTEQQAFVDVALAAVLEPQVPSMQRRK